MLKKISNILKTSKNLNIEILVLRLFYFRISQNKFKERMMLVFQNACRTVFLLCMLSLTPFYGYSAQSINDNEILNPNFENNLVDLSKKCSCKQLTYYLNIEDFVESFIEIPTSNVLVDSTTITSSYLAGRAALYNEKNVKVGTCSASFLNMQNADGIYTDISNYLSVDSGLIVTWFTPTTLINLELDSIVHSMVTECIVLASTKVGVNPFYGKTFNMVVSSDDQKIYFKLTRIKN